MNYDEKLQREVSFKFEEHKRSSSSLVLAYERLGLQERADKVKLCGTELLFRLPVDMSSEAKLYQANFCKDRLCWMCSWRRTLKIFGQVSQVMNKLESERKFRFVFMTLTVRSCSGPLLKSTMDHLFSAFHLFNQRSRIKKAYFGAFRTFEITYHPEKPDDLQFHPHIHLIYATDEAYFKSSRYIKQRELVQIWKQCVGSSYDPHVYIEVVRPSEGGEGDISYGEAVAEVSKYAVKPSDIFEKRTDEEIDYAVWHLTSVLAGRRLCAFTGCFKKAAAALKLEDLNDGDLVNTDGTKIRRDVDYMLITYKWNVGYGYERTLVTYKRGEDFNDSGAGR